MFPFSLMSVISCIRMLCFWFSLWRTVSLNYSFSIFTLFFFDVLFEMLYILPEALKHKFEHSTRQCTGLVKSMPIINHSIVVRIHVYKKNCYVWIKYTKFVIMRRTFLLASEQKQNQVENILQTRLFKMMCHIFDDNFEV